MQHYQINTKVEESALGLHYVAQPQYSQAMLPQQQKLAFQCTSDSQFIQLILLDPKTPKKQVILTLQRPSESDINRLTAYTLPTS